MTVPIPKVALEPTTKKTPQARAPLISTIEAPLAVINVPSVMNTNIAFGSFWPSNTRILPRFTFGTPKQYTPGACVDDKSVAKALLKSVHWSCLNVCTDKRMSEDNLEIQLLTNNLGIHLGDAGRAIIDRVNFADDVSGGNSNRRSWRHTNIPFFEIK
jgi:hypothetical protein